MVPDVLCGTVMTEASNEKSEQKTLLYITKQFFMCAKFLLCTNQLEKGPSMPKVDFC